MAGWSSSDMLFLRFSLRPRSGHGNLRFGLSIVQSMEDAVRVSGLPIDFTERKDR